MSISVCIVTYQRPDVLVALLGDLVAQTEPPAEIIIVDNDAAASARESVEARRRAGAPCPIVYAVEPRKNIALARNLSVALCSGELLALVDDDERVSPDWLAQLARAATRFSAQAILGPVEPIVPPAAPAWIRRGQFHNWPRLPSGSPVPRNQMRLGNALLQRDLLTAQPGPFDAAYGTTGGEDGDLLARLAQSGARVVWCDEAVVYEPIEPTRLKLAWLVRRATRGGQSFARHAMAGRYGPVSPLGRAWFALQAAGKLAIAAVLVPTTLPLGRHHAVRWLLRSAANAGKLTGLAGFYYHEYG